jgi:hypothetical protein
MKILFITYFNGQLDSGGGMCSNRNLKSLEDIFGKENIIVYSISRIQKKENEIYFFWNIKNILVDVFELGFGGLNTFHKKEIDDLINTSNINNVFIDSSLLGVLSKIIKVKYPKITLITFFHNVEIKFFIQEVMKMKKYLFFYRIFLAYISEKLVCKYSDKIIVLNKRDKNQLISIYKRKPDVLIPISLEDKYQVVPKNFMNEKKVGVFVGSYFYPNIQGIKWFIKNVLPFVDIQLIIVGKDMDILKQDVLVQNSSKIIIHNSVPNLTEYYEKADFVILPIFLGGGMKVKTAEALMYGKFLFGTNEAFIGYNISDRIGLCCNTPIEMINGINSFNSKSKYIAKSKELFIEKYSYQSTLKKFQNLFS